MNEQEKSQMGAAVAYEASSAESRTTPDFATRFMVAFYDD